jgi:4-alpha-glucanotransferase
MRLYDAVRVDHFRGFDEYYAIDANAKDARNGSWCRGCGIALFDAIRQKIGVVNGIAEDLGFLTDSVRRLVGESGFASTKVFMLGFDECEKGYGNEYMPHRYGRRSAAYTGTHDNATLVEWLQGLSAKKEARTAKRRKASRKSTTSPLKTERTAREKSRTKRSRPTKSRNRETNRFRKQIRARFPIDAGRRIDNSFDKSPVKKSATRRKE